MPLRGKFFLLWVETPKVKICCGMGGTPGRRTPRESSTGQKPAYFPVDQLNFPGWWPSPNSTFFSGPPSLVGFCNTLALLANIRDLLEDCYATEPDPT